MIALTIIGWILVLVGWVLIISNFNNPKDEKTIVSTVCFLIALVFFIISIAL